MNSLADQATSRSQFGVRTEGIQEALLKIPAAAQNSDRITRMKHILQAVGVK